ncbi:MAG: selenide, water dikinase SelD [Gemmatimonadetes bacterium]|nr:selenide, water dikinase SelD [Gemmatimonadota bacterium]
MSDLAAQVLRRLTPFAPPEVLVGTALPDDAGVYRVADDLAIIFTVDFFTPVVDDPFEYGAISVANSLSDVWAMGGEPFAALNVCAFPAANSELPLSVLGDILEGGSRKAAEAKVAILGGHTVDDPEPKYGLAVIGRVQPDNFTRKGGARPGDKLVLTKPIGSGILTTALKQGKVTRPALDEAVRVMSTLNRDAATAMMEVGAHAATDVTGFGLLGHLLEMLQASAAGARLSLSAIPFLDRAHELAAAGAVPGGTKKNLLAAGPDTVFAEGVSDTDRLLVADAQTSGGLLIAVAADRADRLVRRLQELGTPAAAVIGEITEDPGIRIEP